MINHLVVLFVNTLLISLITFGAGTPAYLYQFGVLQTHWITKVDLASALAFGYATPGPAAVAVAPFIGYRIEGIVGFVVGAIGIFIMPLLLSVLAAKYLNSFHEHPRAKRFIKGVGIAAPGVVATTAIGLLPSHESSNLYYVAITIATFLAITKWKVNPLVALIAGGLLGVL